MKKLILLCASIVLVSTNNVLNSNETEKEKSATANFSTDITLLTSGSSINFVDNSTGSPVSWQWTFEGGQPASYSGKIPPPILYNLSGQYDVVLAVQDNSGNVSIETKSEYIDVVDAPAGWNPQASASTHLISVPATITLSGFPIIYGDFLGVFYLDDNNQEICGGMTTWDGSNNRALIAFGDDATTTVKEGFADGELLRWKVYLSQYDDQADAIVAYNPAMPLSDGNFYSNGMSGITSLDVTYAIPLMVQATASPSQLCAGEPLQLNAIATGGTLSYSYSWSSSPAGFSSTLQNPVVFPSTNTTYIIIVNDGDNTATASTAVEVTIQPDANAGTDATIVAGHSFDVSEASAAGAATLQWATSGDGTFNNYSILNPNYAPGIGDIIAGQVQLCLTAQPMTPCAIPGYDCLNLVIEPSVVVSAGTDQTICANQTLVLSGASAENYSEIMWSTSGSGTFDKSNLLHPEYFPSAADVSLGGVSLCITATALPPEVSSVTDCINISFQQLPEVDAGSDVLVCQGSNINISDANATNAGNLLWITSGAGTFSNQNELNPIYYPDFFDYQAQCIILTLMASGLDPCTTGSQDAIEVCFKLLPQADAGGDQIICATDQAELFGSFQDGCGTIWNTQGDGTFDDASAPQTKYTPGAADIAEGSVQLCFTAQPCDPCATAHTDCLTLTVQSQATVDLGLDALICENEIFVSNTATAANYSQVQWFTPNGTGFFEDESQLLTSYLPSAVDYLVGCVTLGIMVSSVNPCEAAAEDFIELCFRTPPAADVGANATVCEAQSFVATQATAANFSEIQWTGGAGFFNDPTVLNTVYTPAASEVGTSIELCLTASPIDPCSNNAVDYLSLFVQPLPEVFAGSDVTFCEGVIVQLNQATANNYSQVMWIPVSGMGDFLNLFSLTTSYAPSPFDYQAGCITLALMAQPVDPCVFEVVDTLEVCFQKPASVDAGPDQTVCGAEAHQLVSSDALYFNSVIWTTTGDGTFDNPQALHPAYYPGSADIAALSVDITMTAQSISPCTVTDSDALTLTVQPSPDVFAGLDAVLPAGEHYINSDATVAFADSFIWQTSGDGTFDNPDILHPQYTHGSIDQTNGSVTLFLTAQPITPCLVTKTDAVILLIASPPTVSLTADFDICSDAPASLSGSNAGNFASLLWQTSGDGTFDNPTHLNPVYYPGSADVSAGTVELCLTAQPLLPIFQPATDCIMITIQNAPTAFAGNDQTVCESETIELSEATANNAAAVLWSGGEGSFDNPDNLHPVYTPAASEAGTTVTLCLTAMAVDPCTTATTDCIEIAIQNAPTAFAGNDQTVCESETIELGEATASHSSSVLWSGGEGSFDSPDNLHPVYTPAASEAGSIVTLCLTAMAVDPCTTATTDCIEITIQKAPTAFAGNDQTVCESETIELSEATANNAVAVLWSGGEGSFDNPDNLHPVYTPAASEAGSIVTLCLTAMAVDPCTTATTDCIEITIQKAPTAFAGNDQTVCESETIELSEATANNAAAVLWSGGEGSFDNPDNLHPVYTPAASEAGTTVTLCLTAMAVDPCTTATTDCIEIAIQNAPTAFAGNDQTVCESETIELGEATASHSSSVLWSGGEGSFDSPDNLHPVYTPAASEAGSIVTLCLTAMAVDPCTTATTDCIEITIQKAPTAFAGNDQTVCESETIELSEATANNAAAVLWSGGEGSFDNPDNLHPVYTPAASEAGTTVTLCLTAMAIDPCTTATTDCIEIAIQNAPTAFAGTDQIVCESETIELSEATANNAAAVLWSGGEGSFDNPDNLHPVYTPAASEAGTTVTLCLTAMAVDPCATAAMDCIMITIQNAPTAFAGNDQTVCESETIELGEATASHSSSVLWSGGEGSFDSPDNLHPVYTPAASEAGSIVTLCLTAMAIDPCTTATTDCIEIAIQKAPTAFAGTDQTVCESETIELSEATANNAAAVLWSGGEGSFDNPDNLHPTYTPAASEAGTTVTICLTAMAIDPCATAAMDCIMITIQNAPTAFAGTDQTVCESETIELSEATANNAAAVLWSGGEGSFDNPDNLHPVYTPAASEAGTTVTLCLTAMAVDPCATAAMDCIMITIQNAPTAFAGTDQTVCESETIELGEATASHSSSVLWSGGEGSFDNPDNLHPVYTPAASEAGSTVTLCLTAMAVDPCTTATTDCIEIAIQNAPTAFAGNDQTVCESETIELSEATANNAAAVLWSGGEGSFDNPDNLHPVYTPAASEAGTTVTLCLTAMAIDPCTTATTDCIEIAIQNAPTAFAGTDQIVCESETIELSEATANNAAAVLWSGGEGSFDNPDNLHPVYTPAASEAGTTVTLCLTAMAVDPCATAAMDCIMITIQNAPTAFAGNDQTVCESETIELGEATASHSSSVLWSGGEGSFDSPDNLHPVYTPAASEAGTTVTLCLTAMAVDPCTTATTDCIEIAIQNAPTAFAGNDQTVCESETIELSEATANNAAAVLWSGGEGSFDNPDNLHPVYTPAASEAGSIVTLCLTAMAVDPCATAAMDCIMITIQNAPTAFAGTDQTVCESETIELSEATANNAAAVLWSGGEGSFDNPDNLHPVYTPAASEAGTTVTLCLTAMAVDPCATAAMDCIMITIQNAPTAFAGNDQTVCESETIELGEATASHSSSVLWSGGEGSFDSPDNLHPVYTPAASEAGTIVTLCLTAMAVDPCTTATTDCIEITIQEAPTAFAGNDQTVCESDVIQLTAAVTNHSWLVWSTSGDGTFADANASETTYTPGTDDALQGEVKLIIAVQPLAPCLSMVPDDLILTVQACHSLTIPAGWSGLSSWLQPADSNLEDIFGAAAQALVILQNVTGIWWPQQNINTINDWNVEEGYMVKMSQPASILFAGTAAQQTLQLKAGWNLIPVLSRCNVDIATLFAGVDVEIVKEVAGSQLYWPAQNINTLGMLLTGKAYLVKMTVPVTISFPACD